MAAAAGGAAVDPWAQSLRYLMGGVCTSGVAIIWLFRYMQTKVMTDPECLDHLLTYLLTYVLTYLLTYLLKVMTDPECVDPNASKKAKTKTSMGLRDSAQFLAASPYIRNLAALVICEPPCPPRPCTLYPVPGTTLYHACALYPVPSAPHAPRSTLHARHFWASAARTRFERPRCHW